MTERSVSRARAELPALLSRVLAGEEVTITRHGQAVAVLVRPDVLRARRATPAQDQAVRLKTLLEEARERSTRPPGGVSAARADELVTALNADRGEGPWTRSTPTS